MAEESPVKVPTEATGATEATEQHEHTSAADKPVDKESDNVTTSDEKPTGMIDLAHPLQSFLKLLFGAALRLGQSSLCATSMR